MLSQLQPLVSSEARPHRIASTHRWGDFGLGDTRGPALPVCGNPKSVPRYRSLNPQIGTMAESHDRLCARGPYRARTGLPAAASLPDLGQAPRSACLPLAWPVSGTGEESQEVGGHRSCDLRKGAGHLWGAVSGNPGGPRAQGQPLWNGPQSLLGRQPWARGFEVAWAGWERP